MYHSYIVHNSTTELVLALHLHLSSDLPTWASVSSFLQTCTATVPTS